MVESNTISENANDQHNGDWPDVLTDEQVAEYLQIPYSETHIASLRNTATPRLPAVRLSVGGKTYFRYPLDELRDWLKERTKNGNGNLN